MDWNSLGGPLYLACWCHYSKIQESELQLSTNARLDATLTASIRTSINTSINSSIQQIIKAERKTQLNYARNYQLFRRHFFQISQHYQLDIGLVWEGFWHGSYIVLIIYCIGRDWQQQDPSTLDRQRVGDTTLVISGRLHPSGINCLV